jgi:hypothetical protein
MTTTLLNMFLTHFMQSLSKVLRIEEIHLKLRGVYIIDAETDSKCGYRALTDAS